MNQPNANIQDVFRSVAGDTAQGADGGTSGWAFLGVIVLVAGLIAGALLLRRYLIYRKTMTFQRHRMVRSIARELGLSRDQHRDLRRFAKQRGVATPLTLLLCPSLLKRSLRHVDDAERETVERLLTKAA